jgi:hypothetical protein
VLFEDIFILLAHPLLFDVIACMRRVLDGVWWISGAVGWD